jgi:hypothetical protein
MPYAASSARGTSYGSISHIVLVLDAPVTLAVQVTALAKEARLFDLT